jgi:DNA-directed RNA polymerase subunit M/transcription elongation factor TFIIS
MLPFRVYVKNELEKNLSAFTGAKKRNIEIELYDFVCKECPGRVGWDFIFFRRKYRNWFYYLLTGIKKSDLFKELLVNRTLDEVIKMDLSLFLPDLYQKKTENNEDAPEQMRKGQYKCNKCAKNKLYAFNTSYYELQTRSSDEPMSLFVTCLTCNFKYKTT